MLGIATIGVVTVLACEASAWVGTGAVGGLKCGWVAKFANLCCHAPILKPPAESAEVAVLEAEELPEDSDVDVAVVGCSTTAVVAEEAEATDCLEAFFFQALW